MGKTIDKFGLTVIVLSAMLIFASFASLAFKKASSESLPMAPTEGKANTLVTSQTGISAKKPVNATPSKLGIGSTMLETLKNISRYKNQSVHTANGTIVCFDDQGCPPERIQSCINNSACNYLMVKRCVNPGTTRSECVGVAQGRCFPCEAGCTDGKCINATA